MMETVRELTITLGVPLTNAFTPQSRIYWLYLAGALVLAFFVYSGRRAEAESAQWRPVRNKFLAFCFPKTIYGHKSAIVDYKYYVINSLLRAFGLIPIVIEFQWWRTLRRHGWSAWPGPSPKPCPQARSPASAIRLPFWSPWISAVRCPLSPAPRAGTLGVPQGAPLGSGAYAHHPVPHASCRRHSERCLYGPDHGCGCRRLCLGAGRCGWRSAGQRRQSGPVPLLRAGLQPAAQPHMAGVSGLAGVAARQPGPASDPPQQRAGSFQQEYGFCVLLLGPDGETLYVPKKRETLDFGIGGGEDDAYDGVVALYLLPFKKAAGLLLVSASNG